MKAPQMVKIGDVYVTKELAEMLREKNMHRFAKGRQLDPEDLYWCDVVHQILEDMRHPLRYDERFMLAFARRLPRVIGSKTTDDA